MTKPTKISLSPERFTFQRDGYINRCSDNGTEPSADYLIMFDEYRKAHLEKFSDPQNTIHNMEYDLLTTEWILEKVRASPEYAQHLYASLCNNTFVKNEIWPLIKEDKWSCSWRYAGGIIADMRQEGDYIDWYCSGITDDYTCSTGNVPESVVTDEIRKDLMKLGWIVVEDAS